MMMIQVENRATTGSTTVGGISIAAGSRRLFPADRCVFDTEYSDDNYVVARGTFVFAPGNAAPSGETTAAATTFITLGYIGKSGRFTGITMPHANSA